ncbi:hypothetical protein L1887_26298 [Cichorium endivia]|nr:hypothetical protein L1887_26298 [Cichorium endivia]
MLLGWEVIAKDLVIIGGGHAATIVIRAAKKGLVKPTAIVVVAPTWSGPLPIYFGRDSKTEARYELLRDTLRSPACTKKVEAEMEALREGKGVSKFVEVPGALLPQEEYPNLVARELCSFLQDVI